VCSWQTPMNISPFSDNETEQDLNACENDFPARGRQRAYKDECTYLSPQIACFHRQAEHKSR
ncbi:MAG TPA: hypothetical protein VFN35_24940, partial [Ktedonobacteraceae bacterium]|nr:hypothetical protein [Ktedonobacteraceae bacterium]